MMGDTMNFANWDHLTSKLRQERDADGVNPPWFFALGLAGETGEVIDEVKKFYRNDDGVLTDVRRAKIVKELGDALWYWRQLGKELGIEPSEIFAANVKKLAERDWDDHLASQSEEAFRG